MSEAIQTSGCGCNQQPTTNDLPTPQRGTVRGLQGAQRSRLEGIDADSVKGELLTQALAFSGYATDPNALRVYYRQNKDVIDDYLRYVDVEEVVAKVASGYVGTPGSAVQNADPLSIAVGFLGGVAVTMLYFQIFSGQDDNEQ